MAPPAFAHSSDTTTNPVDDVKIVRPKIKAMTKSCYCEKCGEEFSTKANMSRHVGIAHHQKSKTKANDTVQVSCVNRTMAPNSKADSEDANDSTDVDVSDRVLELVMDDRGPASIIMRDTEPREAFAAAPSTLPNQETQEVQMSDSTALEYKCQFCSFQTSSVPDLHRHSESEHLGVQQSNSEAYVMMDDEELMKHALPSHEEDPLRVEVPDGRRRKDALKVETPDGEEEAVHIVCQWMSPQQCAKTFASVYEFNTHVRVDHVEVQANRDNACFWSGCENWGQPIDGKYKMFGHVRFHVGDRPFHCAHPGCGKVFRR